MGIKLSDFIKDPHNVFTQEEAEMIYLASDYVDLGNEYTDYIEVLYELVNKLEEENKRLREALEFYADENNYFVDISKLELPEDIYYAEPQIVKERGIKARQALEGE